MFNRIRLFIRQPFTETRSKNELNRVFSIIDNYKKYPLEILPYKSAGESSDFKSIFEKNTNIKFTPQNFRNYRLDNIRQSNSMLIIRNNMSESTAFELGYIYSKYPNLPIFFAVNNNIKIKTTLLQDIHPNVNYCFYDNPDDIKIRFYNWLDNVAEINNVKRKGSSHKTEHLF